MEWWEVFWIIVVVIVIWCIYASLHFFKISFIWLKANRRVRSFHVKTEDQIRRFVSESWLFLFVHMAQLLHTVIIIKQENITKLHMFKVEKEQQLCQHSNVKQKNSSKNIQRI